MSEKVEVVEDIEYVECQECNEKNRSGYLYIMYNRIFEYYGPNVFKLGRTCDAHKRLSGYITMFIDPSEMKYVSELTKDAILAEKVLFIKLNEYRITSDREFFRCDIEVIKRVIDATIKEVNEMDINQTYKKYTKNNKSEKRFPAGIVKLNNNEALDIYRKNNIDAVVRNKASMKGLRTKWGTRMKILNLEYKDVIENDFIHKIITDDVKFKQHLVISISMIKMEMFENKEYKNEWIVFRENTFNDFFEKTQLTYKIQKSIDFYLYRDISPTKKRYMMKLKNINQSDIDYVRRVFGYENNQEYIEVYDIYNLLIKMYKSLYGEDIVMVNKEESSRKYYSKKGYKKRYSIFKFDNEIVKNHYDLLLKRQSINNVSDNIKLFISMI